MVRNWVILICAIIGAIAAALAIIKSGKTILRYLITVPEMQVDRTIAEQISLEETLKTQGYRLFWGNADKKEVYLQFSDYELIKWRDAHKKKWLIVSVPGGDLPLKTRFSPDEINKRHADFKRKHQNLSSDARKLQKKG